MKNIRITADDLIYALAYASVHRLSIESACQELESALSGTHLRVVLMETLPDRIGMQSILNRMLRQQLQPSIWKCKRDFNIAIDLTLNPYYGQPSPRQGGNFARDDLRYVVTLHFIEYDEVMADTVR